MKEPQREPTQENIERRYRSFLASPVNCEPPGIATHARMKDAARAYETLSALNKWLEWWICEELLEKRQQQQRKTI